MLRLLFTMIFTILLGLGVGYFMWGSRVVRLTESLSHMTLEYDALRSELATRPPRAEGAGPAAGDELRVINEGVAALRQEQAAQRVILDQLGTAGTGGAASSACEENARGLRTELDRCVADKQDLQSRLSGTTRPPAAPQVQEPQFDAPSAPPVQRRPNDPRYENRY